MRALSILLNARVLFGNDTSTFTPWPSVAVLDQTTDVKVAGAGYKSPYATGEPWWSVEQTAALFTSATYAQQFVDSQTGNQWRACTKASHEPPGWVGEPLDGKIQVLQRYPEDTSQFNEAQLRGTGGFGTINWTLGDVTTDKSSTSMKMVGNSSDWMTPHPSEPGRGAYLAPVSGCAGNEIRHCAQSLHPRGHHTIHGEKPSCLWEDVQRSFLGEELCAEAANPHVAGRRLKPPDSSTADTAYATSHLHPAHELCFPTCHWLPATRSPATPSPANSAAAEWARYI